MLRTLSDEEAHQLADRVGSKQNCLALSFEEDETEIRIRCLSDVPLGQATRLLKLICTPPDRIWVIDTGLIPADGPGELLIEQCDVSGPMT